MVFLHVTPGGISSSIYRKIILDSIIVRFGCGLFIEVSVSIYSSKCLHQETAQNIVLKSNSLVKITVYVCEVQYMYVLCNSD